jgi:hypothetical protein
MLGVAGRIGVALLWLARVPETATPAFCEKAAAFLAASPIPEFRDAAGDMLRDRIENEIDSH